MKPSAFVWPHSSAATSGVSATCLDEPTIGLHPRDNRILLDAIDRLTHQGNTLLVVEHDEDTIRQADHIIDIGPGSGVEAANSLPRARLTTS